MRLAIVKRGWDTFERLAAVRVSDARADPRLLPGRRAGAGARVPLSRRRRRAGHAARPARGDARHRAGLGRHEAAAAACRRAGGARPAADRQDDRRAAREEARASPTNACRRGSWRTPRAASCAAAPPPRRLGVSAVADAESAGATIDRGAGAKAGREARAPRTLSGAVCDPRAVDEARRQRARGAARPIPASMPSLLKTPTAANLIRVFRLQERLKSLGKEGDFKAGHVHVVGAGTMGGDIAAWCALRGLTVTLQDQNAERLAPALARAAKLFARAPEGCAPRARRIRPPDPGRRRRRVSRAPTSSSRRSSRISTPSAACSRRSKRKRKPGAILATNTSSIPLEDIASAMRDPSRLVGLHFFNPVPQMMLVEIVVGRQTARRSRIGSGGVRPPDRQAAAAGEERARIPREPGSCALPHDGDALCRRGHRA